MPTHELRLDLLLNRRVYDADGVVLGRLEEVVVEPKSDALGSYYAVREYHVGKYALLESLAGASFARAVLRRFGKRAYRRYPVPWALMDLTDPERPRTTVRRAELEGALHRRPGQRAFSSDSPGAAAGFSCSRSCGALRRA